MARDGDLAQTPSGTPPWSPYARQGFTSYSLNFEDVILHRAFAGQERGFYVDVGAGHPRLANDTCALHEQGWSGINVEPSEALIEAFRGARPGDQNLCLALSDTEGELLFHEIPGTGLSTCDPALAEAHAARGYEVLTRRVPVSTLARVLDDVEVQAVDLLKVDVEGFEEQVLAGNDWTRFRPRLVLVEATYPESPERRPTGIRAFLEARGYRHAFFDGLNDFYAEQDFDALDAFALPPNVFDKFVLREVVDLHAEFRSAQSYAASLESARAEAAKSLVALAAERDGLREGFGSAQAYAASLEKEREALQDEREALQARAAARDADLAAAQRRVAQAAVLEAAVIALLRGRRPAALRVLAANGTPGLMTPASGGQVMDKAQDSAGAGAASVAGDAAADAALASRLLAAQMEGLRAENRRLGLDLDDLREENRRLRGAAEQMRAEILVLSRALEPMHRLNEELASWRPQMRAIGEEMASWRAQSTSSTSGKAAEEERLRDAEQHHRARAEQLSQRAEQLALHVRAIQASSSWRMTRPWRVLGRRLRGQRGGDWPAP